MEPREEWRDVVGWEGLYQVSSEGRIKSSPRMGTRGGLIRPRPSARWGYPIVNLHGRGAPVWRGVHRLVIEAFTGPRPAGLVIRHRDGDPLNNRTGNLVYGTQSENSLDRVAHGRDSNAQKTHCPQGHPLDGCSPDKRRRYCKECKRIKAREWRRDHG